MLKKAINNLKKLETEIYFLKTSIRKKPPINKEIIEMFSNISGEIENTRKILEKQV